MHFLKLQTQVFGGELTLASVHVAPPPKCGQLCKVGLLRGHFIGSLCFLTNVIGTGLSCTSFGDPRRGNIFFDVY